jgi:hypothetical protein
VRGYPIAWYKEKTLAMYRTFDTYTIQPSESIHWHRVENFNKLLEEQSLFADFRECFEALANGKFEFTASCTYRTYKKFFLAFYQAFGPFTAEVSFNEDYHPDGCGYNTSVNFAVDGDGNYVFALVNVLATGESNKTSEEYEKRKTNPQPPFEPNCKREGKIHDWKKSS